MTNEEGGRVEALPVCREKDIAVEQGCGQLFMVGGA